MSALAERLLSVINHSLARICSPLHAFAVCLRINITDDRHQTLAQLTSDQSGLECHPEIRPNLPDAEPPAAMPPSHALRYFHGTNASA